MQNILASFINRYKGVLFLCGGIITGWGVYSTTTSAREWLCYGTGIVNRSGIIAQIFIFLWHLVGGAIWIIPVALFCFSVTYFYGMRLYPEQYCAAVLWSVSTALIAGLYRVDIFTTGPGGVIGVYGSLWLHAILGVLCARIFVWGVWMSCTFVVAYDVLFCIARIVYSASAGVYAWHTQYRLSGEHARGDIVMDVARQNDTLSVLETSPINLSVSSSEQEIGMYEKRAISDEIPAQTREGYQKPNLGVFIAAKDAAAQEKLSRELQDKAHLLVEKLERFGVSGTVISIKRGPVVTLYEYQPSMDTKISKIIALEDDLALALQALSIRIIAPIPGKSVVGFEVANSERQPVTMASIIHSDNFTKSSAQLPFVVGVDTTGEPIVADLARMPHLLIAGSTGSGKSVALNTLLTSLLCGLTPDECRFILIDPKRIEFTVYADVPQLLFPIVTDARMASLVLKWVVKHMEERYTLLAQYGVRSSKEFNQRVSAGSIAELFLPSLVVVIDELADLMMTAGRDVEESIARIAQMARAAGIHLVVATQRPSVDVITGLIKVNFPSRMAFRVASRIDSRTILDTGGADKLLGKGDMLFLDGTSAHVQRLHGAYVSDEEIHAVVSQVKRSAKPQYKDLTTELATLPTDTALAEDGLYHEVVSYLQEIDEVSISLLQRKFRIGYNRSARLIDLLEQQGLIMPPDGARPRKVVR